MKKSHLFKLILILAIALTLAIFARAICDDEASFDSLCIFVFSAGGLLTSVLSQKWDVWETAETRVCRQQIISYLARQEKSPPFTS